MQQEISSPSWGPRKTGVQGPTPLIKGRWPKARGDRERWLAEGQTDEGATIERFRSSQGDFAACGRRVSFWMPRKKPKRHQGAAQDERFALIFAAPGPHFTGAQLGSLAVNAKARVAQSIGFHSITAVAEVSVTFGSCFSWWIARLWSGWGSSAAQRDGVSGDDFRSPQGGTLGRPRFPGCGSLRVVRLIAVLSPSTGNQ